MELLTNKKAKFDLTSVDGNAFSLLGSWSHKAKSSGFTKEEIDGVLVQAKSGDYNNLVKVLALYSENDDDFWEDD